MYNTYNSNKHNSISKLFVQGYYVIAKEEGMEWRLDAGKRKLCFHLDPS